MFASDIWGVGLISGWGVGGGGGLLSEFYGMPRASGVYAASLLFAKCAARDVLDNFEILLYCGISTKYKYNSYHYLYLRLFFFVVVVVFFFRQRRKPSFTTKSCSTKMVQKIAYLNAL